MIELMVVIAIIVIAAGILVPEIAEYLKNREIQGTRDQLTNIFNLGRLQAVTKRRDVSVVFFREGPRVFDELSKQFVDEEAWEPERSVLGKEDTQIWYALGFAGVVSSYDRRWDNSEKKVSGLSVPPFEKWAAKQQKRIDAQKAALKGRRSSRPIGYDVSRLYRVTFKRDGTLVFGTGGADVPTATYNESLDMPPNADVMVFQTESHSAVYIDLRSPGQFRSKLGLVEEMPFEFGDVSSIRSAADKQAKKERRKGRKRGR